MKNKKCAVCRKVGSVEDFFKYPVIINHEIFSNEIGDNGMALVCYGCLMRVITREEKLLTLKSPRLNTILKSTRGVNWWIVIPAYFGLVLLIITIIFMFNCDNCLIQ